MATLVRLTRHKAEELNESALLATIRMIRRLALDQFSPAEIRNFAPHFKAIADKYPVLISKQASLARLRRFNDASKSNLTEDKHVFYRHCETHGIPIPHHIFSTQSADARYESAITEPCALYRLLPDHFIVKDRFGAYGGGFGAFDKTPNNGKTSEGFTSTKGQTYSEAELISFFNDPSNGPLVVQKRAYDHPDLSALSGSKALQTLRIVTYRDSRGFIRPVYFNFKLLNRGNIVDNFSGGATGNLLCFGNIETGTLKWAICAHPSGMGVQTVTVHPSTGRDIAGFRLPLWSETLDAALNAHRTFPPFKVVGWDLAITPEGPKVIEGNIWFDPPLFAPEIMADEDWSLIFGPGYTGASGCLKASG
jgi:hypothetical protein